MRLYAEFARPDCPPRIQPPVQLQTLLSPACCPRRRAPSRVVSLICLAPHFPPRTERPSRLAPRRARRGCPRAGFISCARSPSPASPSSSASSTCRAPIRTWARWWVASPSMAAPSSTTRNGAPPHAAVSAATPWIQLLPLGCHGLGAVLHPVPWEPAAVSVLSLCSVWFASVISLSGCSPPFHPCPISAVSARHFYSHRC